jgi:hypothetical protein
MYFKVLCSETFPVPKAAEIAFDQFVIIFCYFSYMFRLLSLCSEDLGAHAIVFAYNEQTCVFVVHVYHHALSMDEGTIA